MAQADIAIVGVACRCPGDAKNPQALADMLLKGEEAWSKVPSSRFNVDAFHHPSIKRKAGMVCEGGYFLKDDITKWDAPFFSLSATEAQAVDPQQRLLLEVAYEGLENAGIPLEAVADTEMACYVGGFNSNYKSIIGRDSLDTPQYTMTGCAISMLANRVSWFLNIRGPSVNTDTACSSSTTALHLACETIRSNSNKTRTAIVAGTSLILDPQDPCAFSSLGFLSPDSRCFAFDSRANGYARGEGVCVLVLKHIDDAIRDGDAIRAVIRATGINSDGRTAGIVLPSSDAQRRLIESTYESAGLDPAHTQYVEMHGTGTKVGDPAEMNAVVKAMTKGQQQQQQQRSTKLYCGSVKTQIGHLEAAAGLAGVIKCVLAMERGTIPPHLNLSKLNPSLRLESTGGMAVNSFGFGGTNVHVVVDDAQSYLQQRHFGGAIIKMPAAPLPAPTEDPLISEDPLMPDAGSRPYVFVLSAPEKDAIARQRQAYGEYLGARAGASNHDDLLLPRLAHTLSQRRSVFQWRNAVVARSVDELQSSWANASSLASNKAGRGSSSKVALLFTGQGAQWAGMGRELMSQAAFARSVRASAAVLKDLGCEWDAETELMAPAGESRVNLAEMAQPLCTLLQVALVDLLRHWGVAPTAVVGHSSGEMAAAYAAGALSRESCLKVAWHRGLVCRMAQERSPGGGMMAVNASADDVRQYLDDGITLACINSPDNVTLAGDKTKLARLQETLQQSRDVSCRLLQVDNAYHSPQMHTVRQEYRQRIAGIASPDVLVTKAACFYSTLRGRLTDADELLTADYWVDNLCSTVDLVSALDEMMQGASAPGVIIEVGPHRALAGPVNQFRQSRKTAEDFPEYHSLLVRGQDAALTAMAVAATLWTKGVSIQMDKVNEADDTPQSRAVLTDLPSYCWNHSTSYWHESRLSLNRRFPKFPRHDLIGCRPDSFNPLEPSWVNQLRLSEVPWLKEHRVQGNIIFPVAGILSAAIEALRQLEQEAGTAGDISGFQICDFSISQPIIIPADDKGVETWLHMKRRKMGIGGSNGPWLEFSFYSCQDNQTFAEHGSGIIQVQRKTKAAASQMDQARELREEIVGYRKYWESSLSETQNDVESTHHYDFCDSLGISYGPCFQGLTGIRHNNGPLVAFETTIVDSQSSMPKMYESDYVIHPTTLDAVLQSHFVALHTAKGMPQQTWVPTQVESLLISSDIPHDAGVSLSGVSKTFFHGPHHTSGRLMAGDGKFEDAAPWIILEGLQCQGLGSTHDPSSSSPHAEEETAKAGEMYASVAWKPDIDLLDRPGLHKFVGEIDTDEQRGDMMNFCIDGRKIVDEMCRLSLEKLRLYPPAQDLPTHLAKYVAWMESRCANTGLGPDPSPPISPRRVSFQAEEDENWGIPELEEFVKRYPVDGKLLCHVFKSLDSLFAQETTPIASLMTTEYFTRFYKEANKADRNARAFQRWFDLKAHKVPNLRVLEVGAGTAATTLPVLQQLSTGDGSMTTPRLSKLTFSDISAGWFDKAKDLLQDWQSYLEYKVLDIETDPLEQGFEPESYDVIMASNVLHATKDIDTTLRNCHRLLKPGGSLVLGEVTNPSDLVAFIFGTLPGWWAAEDGRKDGPLLLRHQWDAALKETGYSGTDACITDGDDGVAHRMSMIISTKLHDHSVSSIMSSKNIAVVVPNGLSEANATRRLASSICNEFLSLGARTTAIKDITTLTAADSIEDTTVVSLLEVEKPFLQEADETQFDQVKRLLLHSAEVLWVTQSDAGSTSDEPHPSRRIVSGLLRCVKMEDASRRLYEMHLCPSSSADKHAAASIATTVAQRLRTIWDKGQEADHNPGRDEMETCQRNDSFCYIPRYMPDTAMNQSLARATGFDVTPQVTGLFESDRKLRLTVGRIGVLESLHFADVDFSQLLADEEVEMDVMTCGLNFRDVLIAMGELQRPAIGHEAVGVIRRVGDKVSDFKPGQRVVVIGAGVMQTSLRIHQSCVYHAPATLTNHEAAAIPIAYATAYQSLIEVARLQKGESVLIHTAAGALGQALIQLSKMLEADIFCTVSTEAKKQAIIDLGVKPDQIFNSRDLSFEKGIKRVTEGRGVDVVVNSLAGEALRRTWMCLAPYGRFIEVGLRDILSNNKLDMKPFVNNASFSSVNMESALQGSPHGRKVVTKALRLFEQGIIRAQPPKAYDFSHVEAAFREMQRGLHIGKIVLDFTPESRAPVRPLRSFSWGLHPDATYFLIGGLGGLGRAQAEFMVDHGARHLAFLSRSGTAKDEARELVAKLEAAGIETKVYAGDVADEKRLKDVIEDIRQSMPPIRGVIQGAMVLQDILFHKMTHEQWGVATRPKIKGSWALHELLLPEKLDFFILLSSLAGIVGNCSQANYAAGNTFQDALAHYRRSKGLPGLSLNLGVIKGVGYVAENLEVAAAKHSRASLIPSVGQEQFLHLLGCALAGTPNGNAEDTPMTNQLLVGAGSGGDREAMRRISEHSPDFPWLSTLSPFAYLEQLGVMADKSGAGGNGHLEGDLVRQVERLKQAKSVDEATSVVLEVLLGKIASIISMQMTDIDTTKPISTYGVDSLVAVELRNWLASHLRSDMSVFELSSSIPMHELGIKIATRSRLLPAGLAAAG
ncbi:hypothetical protein HIM_01829 [Hirsutella minnesotensis 3608]|nr:hypothetical protein HIM_01829 [Hirsutella minnesotensis 3608]